ncbi:MAG: 50S ribosomal protein L25 [bacterium]|nr:50S ribosomal protein L25 [bacterium]
MSTNTTFYKAVTKNQEIKTINTELRQTGKVESKKLIKQGYVLINLYGKDVNNLALKVKRDEIEKINPRLGQILNVKLNSNEYKAVIKEIQRDIIKRNITHIDMLILVPDRYVEVTVPVEFVGESIGVKKGGVLQILLNKLTIKTLPAYLPEKIEIDLSHLDIGDSIHIGDLKMEGIKFVERDDVAIVTVTLETEESQQNEQSS